MQGLRGQEGDVMSALVSEHRELLQEIKPWGLQTLHFDNPLLTLDLNSALRHVSANSQI